MAGLRTGHAVVDLAGEPCLQLRLRNPDDPKGDSGPARNDCMLEIKGKSEPKRDPGGLAGKITHTYRMPKGCEVIALKLNQGKTLKTVPSPHSKECKT